MVTRSVVTRRKVLLCNEKSDFVTRSVVTSLDPSVGYADTSRRLRLLFSTDLPRHFPRYPFAALLKCFSPSRRTCPVTSRGLFKPLFSAYSLPLFAASYHRTSQMFIAFPADFSPSLPAGCAGTSRRTWSVTSRGFSNRTSRRLCRLFSIFYLNSF